MAIINQMNATKRDKAMAGEATVNMYIVRTNEVSYV